MIYQQHLIFPNTHYYRIRQPSPLAFFIDGDIPMTTATKNNLASAANESEFELTVTQIPDEQRICFWPQYFGSIPQWITLEPAFSPGWTASVTSTAVVSGPFTLSNGGAFMAPDADVDDKWHLFNGMNGNGAEMSAEAAGIAVCLIEYSHHACRTECDAMTAHYYRLRDYALQHPEAHAILRIID
jgi:hypothetical protein